MTHRERMLAAIKGEQPDRLPWIPRLEFWHRAQQRAGTLPAELLGLSRIEIADRLGAGYYAVIPDFTDCPDELDMIDRTLGIFRLPVLPYRVTLEGVDRRVSRRGHETVVEYHTPAGSIRTATVFTQEMLAAGASVPWTLEHAISDPKDFDVVGYIFSHARVEPQSAGYLAFREEVGDRGIVVGYLCGTACPIHHMLKELLPVEQFFYAMHDYPDKVQKLAAEMEPFYAAIKQCAADSAAEVILLGANYDDAITYPPFYRKHILPPLRDYAAELHRRGKFLMTHTDGESRKLLPLFLETGFDVADSVCPHPMTSLTLDDFLTACEGRITVMGGIPAVLLCRDSASIDDCRAYLDRLFALHGRRTRFIAGVSDMVTADADWGRLRYLSDRMRYGATVEVQPPKAQ
jgi:hypothetical protein